ncbi:hypothetical protein BHE90_012988 [Fusarium euwallaceae]|uniref:Uncharacterized protein n=1 Tax=Fusarium euwallaceae TaxID=1147111 RepID=A0A430LA93_9HYPO|nr:hypothetical protein BHE90_012988 [Fusarium euwallaceae]
MAAPNRQTPPLHSRFNAFYFALPEVGENPPIEKRRQYIDAYLNFTLPSSGDGQVAGEYERELHQRAEKFVAARHVAEGVVRMREAIFQYKVDYVYWNQWLSPLAPNAPVWPWSIPAEDPQDKWSATYATLTSDNEVKTMAKEWQESQGKGMPTNMSSEKSDLSNLFLEFAERTKGLHVVGARTMPIETVVGLANTLAQEEHRDNLHHFQGRGKLDTWVCLDEVYKKGHDAINVLDPHGTGCRDHGKVCNPVMVTLDEGVRKLRFWDNGTEERT